MDKKEFDDLFNKLDKNFKDLTKQIITEIIIVILNVLKNKCVKEGQSRNYNVNRFIACIREYNRLWNDIAIKLKGYGFEEDAFIEAIKDSFSKVEGMSAELKKAIDYL